MKPIILDPRAVVFHGDSRDIRKALPPNSVHAMITDPPAGIGFMGKAWDLDKGGPDQWSEWLAEIMRGALEVLKPGGHALVWAIPRTSHWTARALELAGFEIRDVVHHIFGTGFPKSLNVGKAIDAALGAERAAIGTRPGTGTRSFGGEAEGKGLGPTVTDTAPGSPEAAAWEGWGTALKPAVEHWILVRKPLEGTVAANVLAHGTGGLNIDATRIAHASDADRASATPQGAVIRNNFAPGEGVVGRETNRPDTSGGRWPAHLTLDEHAAAILDEQAATVSRFFYCAKAPRSEKDAGLEHLPTRTGGAATDREEGSAGLSNPRAGAGRTGGARNHHPTVKNLALMRWLVRLITPPGGIVLDLFAGSGSTLVAALEEGFGAIGVELTDEYLPILEGRVRHALRNTAAGLRVEEP